MASITKRTGKKGTTYTVRIRIKGQPEVIKTFRRKTDAEKWAQSRQSAMEESRDFPERQRSKRTVREVIEKYLAEGFEKKTGSLDHQSRQLKWWLKRIGHVLLKNLTPEIICDNRGLLKKEKTNRGGTRSNSTVNRYMSALSSALTAAVSEWHWLEKNPIYQIPQLTENCGRNRFLNGEELLRLIKACSESTNKLLLPLFLLAVSTGVRRSEALRLRWANIDLKRRTAYIDKTKNGESRTVPLDGPVWIEILKLHKNRQPDSDLLFPGQDPTKPMDFRTAWDYALKRAGITDFRWHDNRHTTGSYLAMSGTTLAEIADILGQKTIAVANRYSHHYVEHKHKKVKAMNKKHLPANIVELATKHSPPPRQGDPS